MSYNIIKESKSLVLLQETAVDLMSITPTEDIALRHIQVHLFFKGLVGADFKMRLNVYHGDGSLMMRSNPVNNLDISRTGDFYCELRFDFPQIGNLFSLSKSHRVEFEIYDGYNYASTDFVSIMLGAFADLAWLGSGYWEPSWAPQMAPRLAIFTDVINPSSGENFILARLKCGRLITPLGTHLAINGGAHYFFEHTLEAGLDITSFYFEFLTTIMTVTRVEEPIEVDPGDYTIGLNTWYYDKATGLFQFYSAANTTLQGAFGIIEYALHFTNFRGRYFPSTPDTGIVSDPDVYWEPRLSDDVEVSFTQQNNLQGLLSISTSSIILKNHDRTLNDFFSEYDCFNNREVKVWRGQGNSFEFLFQGTIRSVAINDESVEFGVNDMLSVLDKTFEDGNPVYFGNLPATLHNKDINRVIPRSFGRLGPWDTAYYWYSAYPGVSTQMLFGVSGKMPEAACVVYTPAVSTSVNRTWVAGFGPGSVSLTTWPVSTHASVAKFGGTASKLTMDMASIAGAGITDMRTIFAIGDSIKQGTQYGIIAEVDQDSVYVWPYNSSLSTADITRSRVAVVIERGGIQVFPVAIRDYSVSIGPYGEVIITFVNGFETSAPVGLPSALDPASDKVYFRMWNDQDTSASRFLYEQLTSFGGGLSGLLNAPVSGFSPDQSPSWLDPQLSFTLPFAGQGSFPTYREIFEKVLKTAMSFVYFDPDGYIRYKSFLDGIYAEPENVSGIDPETSLTENNSTGFQVQLDLYDLYTGVDFDWSHNPYWYTSEVVTEPYGLQAVKALYKTNRRYQVETLVSVQDPNTPDFLEAFVKLATGRTAVYQLEGFEDHFGAFIGDDFRVSRGKIIGGDDSQMLRTISLTKGVNNVRMGMVDLKRFPTL